MADAKRDQCGVEQHSGMWSSAVSAVVWRLPQLHLESGGLHPSGSFGKCLGTSDAKWEICKEPIYGWCCSVDTAVLITCIDISGVSPC